MNNIQANIKLNQSDQFSLDLDINLPGTGITVIYGPSGSGKTTLLRLLAGLEGYRPDAEINITSGRQIWHQNKPEKIFVPPHRRSVGYVFQGKQLFPHLTVMENLDYAIARKRDKYSISLEQVVDWLNLQSLLKKMAGTLSGGESQRASIGRVLLSQPDYILMDEPLGSVDTMAKDHVLPYLEGLHRDLNVPVIYVTHSLEELSYLADRVILIDKGRVIDEGSIFDISTRIDTHLAKEDAAVSVVSCEVKNTDSDYGLTELIPELSNNERLFITNSRIQLKKGEKVRVQIPARDVSIRTSPDSESSILNTLKCRIVSVLEQDKSRVVLQLQTGRQFLVSRITRKSYDRLGLGPQQEVYAQIKSVALFTEHYEN